MDGFPPAQCRVAAARSHGVDAYVVLDTGPAGQPYLYGVCVRREGDGWVQGTSSNGGGWSCTDAETRLGTAAAWGEAPDGADRVRVACGGAARESSVENGVYLAAWWRVPDTRLPRVEAFRIRGAWIGAA